MYITSQKRYQFVILMIRDIYISVWYLLPSQKRYQTHVIYTHFRLYDNLLITIWQLKCVYSSLIICDGYTIWSSNMATENPWFHKKNSQQRPPHSSMFPQLSHVWFPKGIRIPFGTPYSMIIYTYILIYISLNRDQYIVYHCVYILNYILYPPYSVV